MEKIKSISEAFSMQPIVINVVKEPNQFNPEQSCKEILLKCNQIFSSTGSGIYTYCGYNFDGKKIFQYIASAVNVHYF